MTTMTIDVDEDQDDIEVRTPRRVVLITLAVLLPAEMEDAPVEDILPTGLGVEGFQDCMLTDFIQTTVQEARLVMT